VGRDVEKLARARPVTAQMRSTRSSKARPARKWKVKAAEALVWNDVARDTEKNVSLTGTMPAEARQAQVACFGCDTQESMWAT